MQHSDSDINLLARRLNIHIAVTVAVAFIVIILYTSYRNYVLINDTGQSGSISTFLVDEISITMFAMAVMVALQLSLRHAIYRITLPVVRGVNRKEEANRKLESELKVAHSIQKSLLPRPLAVGEIDGVNVTGYLHTARQVGGDLYDYFINGRTLYFAIGDVSGKGVPAALTMATTRRLLRTLMKIQNDLTEVMATLNDALCDGNDSNQFVTLIIGSLNIDTGRLTICNAGHTPPYILDARGNVRPVEMSANLPVGIFPKYKFKADHLRLKHSLLLYTDGITEAESPDGKQFGMGRLLECIEKNCDKPIASLVDNIVSTLMSFVNETEHTDDVSLLGVELVHTEYIMERHLVLKNNLGEVVQITKVVEEVAALVGLDEMATARLTLALEEAAVNVISYAYPDNPSETFEMYLKVTNKAITFTLVDHGSPFDPTVISEPDITADALDRPIGGLGILLVKKCMTSVLYERENGENHLQMIYNYG